MKKKLGIVLSHPVQYYAPLFKYLAQQIDLIVFYGHQPNAEQQGRSGFGKAFAWDVDLLSGYEHEFLENKSNSEYFNHFKGISVPDIGDVIKKNHITHVLILGWHYKFYLQALWYCKRQGIPVSVRGDSQLAMQKNVLKSMFKRLTYPIFLKFYNKILYVGQRNKEYYKHFLVSESKLIYSPHAVDQDFWKIQRNADSDEIIFLWIGKFIDKKHPRHVLKAFSDLRSSTDVKIKLKMVGSGELHESCIQEFGHKPDIEFLGFKNQTEIRELYKSASCLILSSDGRETWGLVVNEAFSCGVPAIVSDACGCAPDMINEDTGFNYEFGNLDSLTNSIRKFLKRIVENGNFYNEGIQKVNQRQHFSESVKAVKSFLAS